MHNVIFLEFFNKKSFPPGEWNKEPDLSRWTHNNMDCLAIRDMSLGIWRGFVGINKQHIFYKKSLEDILATEMGMDLFFDVDGRLSSAARLPVRYKEYSSNLWWIGIDTAQGSDYMPLLKLEDINIVSQQTYKNFSFIRQNTNKLARLLFKI